MSDFHKGVSFFTIFPALKSFLMNSSAHFVYLSALVLLGCSCQAPNPDQSLSVDIQEVAPHLPFTSLPLEDMEAFLDPGNNWKVSSGANAALDQELDLQIEEGTGILVNLPSDSAKSNLTSKMQHGDIEIQYDVLMPKGSNSGVYFQGRYEVQLFDSWGVSEPAHHDMGGIYQRWDDSKPEEEAGYEGIAPIVNAAKAPGLWQHFHIWFKAPRFDANGNKVANATFKFVRLNGFTIHENVELTGPTRGAPFEGEAAEGPLFLQGDHGPVAFRNIQYKVYGFDTLELRDIAFQFFQGKWDYIPDFNSLEAVESGQTSVLDPKTVTNQADHYGLIFTGSLDVKQEGTYLFETKIDDGGDLYIDDVLIVANEGEPGMGTERALAELTAGTHKLTLTYYQEVWNASIQLFYEGPKIAWRPLASSIAKPAWMIEEEKKPKLQVEVEEKPELLRGFVTYGDEKLTHAISVGMPSGVHYSYDLDKASLVKSWRGRFLDVTDMWRGRGQSQLSVPLNASIDFFNRGLLLDLKGEEELRYLGYSIDQEGLPHFRYQIKDHLVTDHILPGSGGGLKRVVSVEGDGGDFLWYLLGSAEKIIAMEDGMYNIGGLYYVKPVGKAEIREHQAGEQLVMAISSGQLQYEILW